MGILRIFLALSFVSEQFGRFMWIRVLGSRFSVQSFYFISGFNKCLVSNEKAEGVMCDRDVWKWPFLIVLACLISRLFRRTRHIKIDNTIREFSYYIFLAHLVVAVLFRSFKNDNLIVILIGTMLMSWLVN